MFCGYYSILPLLHLLLQLGFKCLIFFIEIGALSSAGGENLIFGGYLFWDKLKYNFSNVPTEDIATIAALVQNAEAEAKKAIQAIN